MSTSKRLQDWCKFSSDVGSHIESYTVPQYGDKGDDQCSEFDLQDFMTNIKRYANRAGKNQRPGQARLDMLKIAHYAQMASLLMEG